MLSEEKILKNIAEGKTFEATLDDGSITIKIQEYLPYLCTAIHAGDKMRSVVSKKCLLTKAERKKEEDPYTDDLISPFPMTIVSNDSRYEYDLNRAPDQCIYTEAWNQKVWKSPLNAKEKQGSLDKHARYYRIIKALVSKIESIFGGCIVIDLHSFNYQRDNKITAPVFNLGTAQIDNDKWQKTLDSFKKNLSKIELPNLNTTVEYNAVFQGRGYQATFVKNLSDKTLLIPLEIKKIFMDEITGEAFPLVIESLRDGLYEAIIDTAMGFNASLNTQTMSKSDFVSSEIEPIVFEVDAALYKLASNVDTLLYVNPVNLLREKRKFYSNNDYIPDFHYRQLRVDPYLFREQLYQLPVSKIQDPALRRLYRDVVDNYATKIELLTNVATPHFLYNSLRYYGEPSSTDLANAEFLLHIPNIPDENISSEIVDAQMAKERFEEEARQSGLDCKVMISTKLIAKAMVNSGKKLLLVNKDLNTSRTELEALVHHELGIHMSTTMNAELQPLKVLKLGFPGNTHTQEGMAILSEYLSGNLTSARLRILAIRVIAVDAMVKGANFCDVYNLIRHKYNLSRDDSFNITVRVCRGGGFTKDYLYLKGLRDLVKLNNKRSLTPLLVGKTSCNYIDVLEELIDRKILIEPKYIPKSFSMDAFQKQPILNYLIKAIK